MKAGYSAFPIPDNGCTDGLTMRDYIAIHALDGDVSYFLKKLQEEAELNTKAGEVVPVITPMMAKYAYADAMIAESEKSRG